MKTKSLVSVILALTGLLVVMLVLASGDTSSRASVPVDLTPTAEPPTPTPGPPCVTGKKIDDLHVGLPGWTIHAKPCTAEEPVLTAVTDGGGFFRFSPLTAGCWTLWEELQPGWAAVTPWIFNVEVQAGAMCVEVRFKNRQACAADLYEPDNTVAQARTIIVNGPAQKHTLEPPSDLDWLSFDALAGRTYELRTDALIGETDTVLTLFGPDGTTILASNDDAVPGSRTSLIRWTAPASGRYFVEVRDLYQTGLRGCLGYQVSLTTPTRPIWLPLILVQP